MLSRLLVALAALLVLGMPAAALADEVRGVDVQSLERELRCPTCNGPLAVSDSPAADQIKQKIRSMAAEGKTSQQIKDALVADFGREILADPPKEGFDLVAWLVPSLGVLAGLAVIPFLTRRWARRGRGDAAVPASSASADELERLEAELRARDEA